VSASSTPLDGQVLSYLGLPFSLATLHAQQQPQKGKKAAVCVGVTERMEKPLSGHGALGHGCVQVEEFSNYVRAYMLARSDARLALSSHLAAKKEGPRSTGQVAVSLPADFNGYHMDVSDIAMAAPR